MATRNGFGAILRSARLDSGYQVDDIASRLRVRSDIIEAIEREDFSRIPPKAYTKNMISSYARIVGVDPELVTSLYLDEAYGKNLSKTRSEMDRFNRINERIVNRTDTSEYDTRPYTSASEVRSSVQSRYEAASRSSERLGRTLYSAHDDYPAPVPSRSRRSRSYDASLYDDDYSSSSSRRASASSSSRDGRSSRRGSSTRSVNLYTGGSLQYRRSKKPFIIAGIVIVLIIAIAFGVMSCQKQDTDVDVSNAPISGLNDPEKVNSGSTVDPNAKPTPIAPSAATFSYQVPEGESVYYELYLDGAETPSEADTLDGPTHDSFEVTGTLRFVTTNPDGITVRVDGNTVDLVQSENTSWLYECTVDFPAMLEAWKEANLNKPEETSAATTQNTQTESNSQSVTVKRN
ncbi:MAG: helix-turn-helix domain-containing protein [Eggerthellaceae bacterium]|nr:helix-turn-helix domain-containing protein [Eggerthellaceae bacterium]